MIFSKDIKDNIFKNACVLFQKLLRLSLEDFGNCEV